MVLLGHAHTHEFAIGGTTDQVGNPWSLRHSAGGSSGASAAALAPRVVPAATGTDTAGSLRIPASFCGVSAIKASHGRLPIDGIIPLAPTFDHAGPMARTVADCAALCDTLAAPRPQLSAQMPLPAPPEPPRQPRSPLPRSSR
jgi:aspartyl-tRNA(Asn)/glutamyl-tRNA(Gln) amidotransferase subunit A